MKTIRLLLVSVLASIGLAASAQSYLPQKSAFSIGIMVEKIKCVLYNTDKYNYQ